jgi:hypothetical protein
MGHAGGFVAVIRRRENRRGPGPLPAADTLSGGLGRDRTFGFFGLFARRGQKPGHRLDERREELGLVPMIDPVKAQARHDDKNDHAQHHLVDLGGLPEDHDGGEHNEHRQGQVDPGLHRQRLHFFQSGCGKQQHVFRQMQASRTGYETKADGRRD